MKRIISLVLLITLLVTGTFIAKAEETASVIAANGTTVVEAELMNYNGGFVRANGQYSGIANASGEKVLIFEGGYTATPYTATVSAAEAGFYKVSLLASAADGNMSNLYVEINGKSVNVTTSTAKSNVEGSKGAYGIQIYRFDNILEVFLKKGNNTVSLSVGKRPNTDVVLTSIDAFEFTKKELIAVEEGTATIEAESFDGENNRNISKANGQKTIAFYSAGYSSYSILMGADIKANGFYEVEIQASANDGTSAVSGNLDINMNNTGAVRIGSSNCEITDLGYCGWNDAGSGYHQMKNFKYKIPVYLEAGVSTFELTFTPNASRSDIFGAIDSIKVTPYNLQVVGESAAIIEAESFDPTNNRNISKANGQKTIAFYSAGLSSYSILMGADIKANGFYEVEIQASANDGTSAVSGNLDINMNNTGAVRIGSSNCEITDLGYCGWNDAGSGYHQMKNFKYKIPVYLEAGVSTFELTFTPNASRSDIFGAIDSIKLTPYNLQVVGESAAIIEAESFDYTNNRNISYASGLKTVAFYDNAPSTEYSILTGVKASTAGYYSIALDASANSGTSSVHMNLGMKVNNEAVVALNGESCDVTALGFDGWRDDLNDQPVSRFEYNEPVYLNEGFNTVEVVMTANSGRGTIFGSFDCIRVSPLKNITSIDITADDVMIIGEETTIVVKDQNGDTVTAEDVYQITYDTSDDDILTVDGNGKIVAVGEGITTVSAAVKVTSGAVEIVDSAVVRVTSEAGIYLDNVQKTNGTVNFDFVALKDYSDVTVYVASYDSYNNITAVDKIENISSGNAGTAGHTAILDGYEAGNNVFAFVWQGMKPIGKKISM